MEKSKLSAPHREVYFIWDYEQNAVDEVGYLIAAGLESGVITREGNAGWKMGRTKVNGRAKFKEKVASSPEMQAKLRTSIFPGSPEADSPKDE